MIDFNGKFIGVIRVLPPIPMGMHSSHSEPDSSETRKKNNRPDTFHIPWAPKTMKNKGFGHLKTRLFTIKTSKNLGFGAHGIY